MGKTFKQAQDALADWLGAVNLVRFPQSARQDIINITRRELSRLHDLRFNEVSDTFATVAGTRGYTLPTGWSRPHTLWYLDTETTGIVFLEYLSKEKFDLNFPDSTKTAKPSAYTVWANQIQLGKTPDRVLTINRNYYSVLADLVNDNDIDDLMTQAWEAVHFKALVNSTRYGIEDSRIGVWKDAAMDYENQLVIEHGRSHSVGKRAQGQEPG